MLRRRPARWRPVPPSAVPALALNPRVLETAASARSAPGRRVPPPAATARRYWRNMAPRRAADAAAGSCLGPPRVRLPGSEQPRDVARDRVDFEVHALPRRCPAKAGVSQGVGDDVDAETGAV